MLSVLTISLLRVVVAVVAQEVQAHLVVAEAQGDSVLVLD
jgi:hypothetical protein